MIASANAVQARIQKLYFWKVDTSPLNKRTAPCTLLWQAGKTVKLNRLTVRDLANRQLRLMAKNTVQRSELHSRFCLDHFSSADKLY